MIPGPRIMKASAFASAATIQIGDQKDKNKIHVQSMCGIKIIITVARIIDGELQCRGHNHTPSLKNKSMAFIL